MHGDPNKQKKKREKKRRVKEGKTKFIGQKKKSTVKTLLK